LFERLRPYWRPRRYRVPGGFPTDVETKKINALIAEIKKELQQFIEDDEINVSGA
jgi:hypothetical protein